LAQWQTDNITQVRLGARATAIAVSCSNVYIAGCDGIDALYWLNDIRTVLSKSGTNNLASANAIAVSGSNVYIAGYDRDDDHKEALYWLNGKLTVLPKSGYNANALGIAVIQ
jgi:hypothetical protein